MTKSSAMNCTLHNLRKAHLVRWIRHLREDFPSLVNRSYKRKVDPWVRCIVQLLDAGEKCAYNGGPLVFEEVLLDLRSMSCGSESEEAA
jgi:hypothetical protein